MDVKENLTNILHAVGVRFEDGMTDKDIRKKLDLQNPAPLLTAMRRAVGRQLENDRTSARNVLAKGVAYDRTAVLNLLAQTTNLNPDAGTALLDAMSQDDYGVTDIVIHGLVEGLPEQQGMTPKLAEQSAGVLNNIMQAEYTAYLRDHHLTAEQFPFVDYQQQRNRDKITTMLTSLTGDAAQAQNFLDQPIDENNPILANNPALHDKFLAAKAQRSKDGADQVRAIDVLTMFSQSVTQAQVLAFYENRVIEQNKVGENGEILPNSSPTKIDNVLGKAGRKATEEAVGQRLTNRMMPQTKVAPGKPLPDHKWRGYQRLAALIKSTVSYMYSVINGGWMVEKMYNRNRPSGPSLDEDHATQARGVVSAYQPMPEVYQGTPAGAFFSRTQARMLDDKTKVTALRVELQNALQPNYTMDNFKNYLAGQAAGSAQHNAQLDQCAAIYDQIVYLQRRIAAAEAALADLPAQVSVDPNALQNSVLFDQMDRNIVCLACQRRAGEEDASFQQRSQANANFIAKDSVAGLVDAELDNLDKDKTNYLQAPLQRFLRFNNSQNDVEKAASFEMLADLFGIRNEFNAGQVTVNDLQDLLNDQQTGPFNPVKANAMIQGFQDGTLSDEKCRQVLHDSATTFLQAKQQAQNTNQNLNRAAAEQIQNM